MFKPIAYVKLAVIAAISVTAAIATASEHHSAAEAALRKHSNVDKNGLALQGYDPVAYFTQERAIKGSAQFTASHPTGTYRFASAENRDLFAKDPDRYVPAYGGWCATAMAKDKKVEIDPENFKITSGRLFLFYKSLIQNALTDWNKDETDLTKQADANWNRLVPHGAAPSASSAGDEPVATGKLEGRGGHKMSGTAKILKIDSSYSLVLESDFTFDGAPAPRLGFGKGGYMRETKFSKLNRNKGMQTYALPAGLDPTKYDEFWVWCDKFNVPLGSAKLNFASKAE